MNLPLNDTPAPRPAGRREWPGVGVLALADLGAGAERSEGTLQQRAAHGVPEPAREG